eukprot:SAG31_NODE_45_length_31062_cov_17.179957_12_plen_118_part_00
MRPCLIAVTTLQLLMSSMMSCCFGASSADASVANGTALNRTENATVVARGGQLDAETNLGGQCSAGALKMHDNSGTVLCDVIGNQSPLCQGTKKISSADECCLSNFILIGINWDESG